MVRAGSLPAGRSANIGLHSRCWCPVSRHMRVMQGLLFLSESIVVKIALWAMKLQVECIHGMLEQTAIHVPARC